LETRLNKLETFGFINKAYSMAAGNAQVTVSAATSASVSITYPANRFTVTPVLTFTPTRISSNSAVSFSVRVIGANSTGATLTVEHRDGSNITETIEFDWIAVQMTSTTANG
jgi:hypothetical protein